MDQFIVLVWPPPGCRQGNPSKLQSPVAKDESWIVGRCVFCSKANWVLCLLTAALVPRSKHSVRHVYVYIYIWKYTVHTKNNHISQVLKYLGGLEIEFLSGFSCRIWGFLQARVRGGSPWWLTSINRSRTWTTCAPRPFSRDVKSRCWAFLGTFTSREGPFFSQILRRYHANKYVKEWWGR